MVWKPEEMRFILSVNTSRLKNIMKKHLRSAWKLVREQEKEHVMETWELCLVLSVNTSRLKNIMKKHLRISKENGDRKSEGTCYGNLGNVFCSLGEYVKAKEYYEKALAISMEIGDRAGEGTWYGNLGTVFCSIGEYVKAKEYYEKALAISMELRTEKEKEHGMEA